MSITELLESVQFVVDNEGKKRAAILELSTWETVLTLLEDLEDTEELRQVRQERDENLPWEQVKADYRHSTFSVLWPIELCRMYGILVLDARRFP